MKDLFEELVGGKVDSRIRDVHKKGRCVGCVESFCKAVSFVCVFDAICQSVVSSQTELHLLLDRVHRGEDGVARDRGQNTRRECGNGMMRSLFIPPKPFF